MGDAKKEPFEKNKNKKHSKPLGNNSASSQKKKPQALKKLNPKQPPLSKK
jgi:hypothetical protein